MLVVMMQQVKVVPFAPESNRDRFLHVKWMSISNSNWTDGKAWQLRLKGFSKIVSNAICTPSCSKAYPACRILEIFRDI
jgi:hypothetical protein